MIGGGIGKSRQNKSNRYNGWAQVTGLLETCDTVHRCPGRAPSRVGTVGTVTSPGDVTGRAQEACRDFRWATDLVVT
jgi:hypothetical protein